MDHYKENIVHGRDHTDTHASDSKWRHQESSSFAKHAALSAAPKKVREADEHSGVSDLADFLNKSRIDGAGAGVAAGTHKPILVGGHMKESHHAQGGSDAADMGAGAQNANSVTHNEPGQGSENRSPDGREVKCGPLINYRRMEGRIWFGSVLIVTRGGTQGSLFEPELILRKANGSSGVNGDTSNGMNGLDFGFSSEVTNRSQGGRYADGQSDGASNSVAARHGETKVKGVMLYGDLRNVFWRFNLQVEMDGTDTKWEYAIPGLHFQDEMKKTDRQSFHVPALDHSMRVMFHSCNGFSVGTDEEAWSGPALWNDVLRVHKETPFHVMIGGGDQIYNDGIRVNGPLQPWSSIPSPRKRREYKFPETLRKDCDDYYVANYIRWYATEPFASANGQIPQINLWDDHDIIDGFGSYVDGFMKCDVFRGIGGTAYKYYMLFQHHLAPPISTYTTDAPQTMEAGINGVGADPAQTKDTYVLQEEEDPCYMIGAKPGPYVAEHSRSIYARLGARMAFFGIDARTERTRHQVNYPETYEMIFARLRKELGAAASSSSSIRHLIVLLGIPIAYPRLTWLENILQSPLIGPIKFLHKRFGVAGGVFNKFDGGVDLLDDLDDHYTARTHKQERLGLTTALQDLAAEFSVRITILSGDVHLAACGRFYSNPKLGIAPLTDHRYMANIISSAIVNKPPPSAIANLLARRNKIHHLDEHTDETLLNLFDRDPGERSKTASSNHSTMPSRNWAMITENAVSSSPPTTNGNVHNLDGAANSRHTNGVNGTPNGNSDYPLPALDQCTGKDGHNPLHPGEATAGTQSRAATNHGRAGDGSIDICIRVEMDQHDKLGHTRPYGLWIPPLKYEGSAEMKMRKRDAIAGAIHARA